MIGISQPYQEEDLDIKTLWSAFRPALSQITNRVGSDAFGIYEQYRETDTGTEFSYICSVEVSDNSEVPEGLIARTLPEQLFAVFRHDGPISSLPDTFKYIWGSWLPKSKYEYVEKPDFELYAQGVQPDDPEKILFLHIPIALKRD